ncbi:MAG TPA: sigma-70 family RNA polymerase sigma factor, partial [Gemmataceae bacterium]|nr:sigma-70 family RNA polymerase sigma factor [Gemmataceae bacterium]
QATFLVLARKAGSVQPREAVGNWLYGVAYRTALEARTVNARRRGKEKLMGALPERAAGYREPELREVLDRELSRLPDKYRLPIVLCELEGRSRQAVARQLGLPEGTLSSRLATGRKMLAKRLTRYGPEISSAALGAVLAESAAAAIPAGLAGFTAKAAIMATVGPGAVSAPVLALAEGVVKAMLIAKLKVAGALVLIVAAVVAAGAGGVGYRVLAGEQDQPVSQIQPQREAVRAAQSTPAQLAETEARLKAEVSAAEADAARATATLEQLKAKLNDLQRRREEDAAVQRNGQAMASLARRFRYRVPVEIGFSEFKDGGQLEILEVWGTRPKIEIGGQYVVRGKYVLPQEGTLYFYETASGNSNDAGAGIQYWPFGGLPQPMQRYWNSSGATLDLQTTRLAKGQGEFTVVHGMAGPGSFHLVLAAVDKYSNAFANVYFGTGDNVWRKRP